MAEFGEILLNLMFFSADIFFFNVIFQLYIMMKLVSFLFFMCALHPALLSHLILFDSLDRER